MPCNFITMAKTYQQINERIKNGEAVVLTAEEVSQLALTMSPEEIADKVDVVTTGTFGAMCSSGAFINFGHSDPPIRMERIELNGVGVSGGLAAVDTYIGATDCNPAIPNTAERISSKTSSTARTFCWRPGAKGPTAIPAATSAPTSTGIR